MSMNMFCCKQIFQNEDEVSKGYSKEHQRSQQLQTTKTLSQSNPQSEENNQDLQQPQINNQDKADMNIQEKEKVQFNNQQEITNQTNDNHKLQTATQQELDITCYEQKSLKDNNTYSIAQVLKALCNYCNQWVSQNYIMLECQHIYCIECFKEELKQQCQTSDCIKLYCRCNGKISEKTILLLRKHQLILNILDKLRKNQIGKLVSQVRQFYKTWTCPNKYCSFICIIQDNLNITLFYCPNCLSFTGQ